jgi:hypothetical protein
VLATLPRLILSAVRFIPNIVDTTGMADKMAEILQVFHAHNALHEIFSFFLTGDLLF